MAWRSHGTSNPSLVEHLKINGLIKDAEVERAFLAVDRGCFVEDPSLAYMDSPQYIGHNATISAPHMHAHCVELLRDHLKPGASALDVGSGSGYLTCVMARLVGPEGFCLGIEHIPELVDDSHKAVSKLLANADKDPVLDSMWKSGKFTLQVGDGRASDIPGAPFHAIHVGAAAPEMPQNLVSALAPGGRLVVPVGPEGGAQVLMVVDKHGDGRVTKVRGQVWY